MARYRSSRNDLIVDLGKAIPCAPSGMCLTEVRPGEPPPPISVLIANDDSFNGDTTMALLGTVLTNDTLNGVQVTASQVTITALTAVPPELTFDTNTGDVSTNAGADSGTYTFQYQICEVVNPSNCDAATVTVTITATVIVANDDAYSGFNSVDGGTTASVLDNDTLAGVPVTTSTVILTPGTAPAPASGSITMNADGTITIAAGTTAGTYTYSYTICEAANTDNCSSAVATITVDAGVIVANDDAFSAQFGT